MAYVLDQLEQTRFEEILSLMYLDYNIRVYIYKGPSIETIDYFQRVRYQTTMVS